MKRTIDYSLYLVTDRKVTDKKGRDFYEAVEEALQAGITLVQLREKDVTTEERIAIGRKVKILCDHYDVPLLVDDDIACAKAIGADGVHLGQSDESLARGRQELGNDAIIGISAHNLEEAQAALRGGADYLGVGALYPTETKKDASCLGLGPFREIIAAISLPIVGIGGIGKKEFPEVMKCGAAGCAMISSILGAEDITATVKAMKIAYEALRKGE